MLHFKDNIAQQRVHAGSVAVFWLGQAGFVFKTADGVVAAVDPYLSDCCARYFGFRRLMPKLADPSDFPLDALFCTHAHYDHFDPDAVPLLLANGARLYAARDCATECARLQIEGGSYLQPGDAVRCGDLQAEAVRCDHGAGAPDAIGLVLTAGGKRIYFMGDTCLRPDWYDDERLQNADLLIAPINGAFGNLNEAQAAQAAWLLHARHTIPCHYWNFAEHGGDPQRFAEAMRTAGLPYTLLPMGGCLVL